MYLVQLANLPFGAPVAEILANPSQVKAGVGIGDDMRDLARLHAFEPAGLVDLGGVARAHRLSSQGLRTLAANLFGWRISKGVAVLQLEPQGADPAPDRLRRHRRLDRAVDFFAHA